MACAPGGDENFGLKASEDLKCPVCLERYKTPRVLDCLHTYCEGCIHSCIIKAVETGSLKSSIQCPVCRKETSPPSPGKPPTEWASEFPLNSALLPILETANSEQKKSSAMYARTLTGRQELSITAMIAISINARTARQTIPSSQLLKSTKLNFGRLEFCEKHADEKVKLYCEDHKKLCCTVCAFLHHRVCQQVREVTELGQTLKKGDTSKELREQLKALLTSLAEITKSLETNILQIKDKAELIPQQLIQVRNKIVTKLDQLVTSITSVCGHLKKQHVTDIEDKITGTRSLEAAITSSRSFLEALLEHGTEPQIVLAIERLGEQVSRYQTQIQDTSETISSVEIQLVLDDGLSKILETNLPLAKVEVQRKRHQMPLAVCEMKKITFDYHRDGYFP